MKAKTAPQHQASFRKQIGSALWLWELLVNLAPDAWDAKSHAFVAGGRVLSDRQLGIWLDANVSTIAAWRRRLKAAALLDWTIKPGVGRVYVVSPMVGRNFFESEKPPLTSKTKLAEPQTLEICRPDNKPLASRFIQ